MTRNRLLDKWLTGLMFLLIMIGPLWLYVASTQGVNLLDGFAGAPLENTSSETFMGNIGFILLIGIPLGLTLGIFLGIRRLIYVNNLKKSIASTRNVGNTADLKRTIVLNYVISILLLLPFPVIIFSSGLFYFLAR